MPVERKNAAPMPMPCFSCDMKCCAHFAVPLTGRDVERICAGSGKTPLDFCALVNAGQIEAPMHARIFFFDAKGELNEKMLVLGKKENRECLFFKKGKGCTIHGHHPLPCIAYPFVFGMFDNLVENQHFVCPRKWKKGEYDEKEIKDALSKFEKEVATHNKIVREWNATWSMRVKADEAEDKFLGFLLKKTKEKES
jgi:Fe-S-cluster containining protein